MEDYVSKKKYCLYRTESMQEEKGIACLTEGIRNKENW
ncbi:hypothetical protein bcere0014_22150 [Bacillus cereus BDRD-ST196]|nr:hypothetical protein bcere0014_22150 [Bacillus cereus BDRD-ST196]